MNKSAKIQIGAEWRVSREGDAEATKCWIFMKFYVEIARFRALIKNKMD
jgi:hypothetical protein